MALWTRDPRWWELVDRASVIQGAADFATEGGVLVFGGPSGFGHLEAVTLAVRQLRRYGWVCHDLTTDGPLDVARLMIVGLESMFPTAPHGVSQRAQLAGLGTSALAHHARDVCSTLDTKHCLIAPYADDTHALGRPEVSFLARVAKESPICFLLTSTSPQAWEQFSEVDMVELEAFSVLHVRNCLLRGSNTEGFTIGTLDDLRDSLEDLSLADGTVVPQAAYTWLRQHGTNT